MHRGKPFFFDLVKFMISGLCVFITLEGENIINKAGKLIEDINRNDHADSVVENAVHASKSPETANFEVGFFFPEFAD